MRYLLAVVLIVSLAGCDTLYYKELPEGMLVTETLYESQQELSEVCGDANACVYTNLTTFCHMHLPLAGNGDVMKGSHEVSHCAGRKDAP